MLRTVYRLRIRCAAGSGRYRDRLLKVLLRFVDEQIGRLTAASPSEQAARFIHIRSSLFGSLFHVFLHRFSPQLNRALPMLFADRATMPPVAIKQDPAACSRNIYPVLVSKYSC